jgi:hypothetical protein
MKKQKGTLAGVPGKLPPTKAYQFSESNQARDWRPMIQRDRVDRFVTGCQVQLLIAVEELRRLQAKRRARR